MAEALAAIGLASSIVQFIDFSIKILTETREIAHSASGMTTENAYLETIATDLSQMCGKLAPLRNHPTIGQTPEEQQIYKLAKSSKAIAEELLSAISRLKKAGGRHGYWANLRQALKGVWSKDIGVLKGRLTEMRSQLSMHVITHISAQQEQVLERLNQLSRSIGQLNSGSLNAKVGFLKAIVGEPLTVRSPSVLTWLEQIADNLSDAVSGIDRLRNEHEILSSLAFEEMHIRETTIVEAHTSTFEWIFTPERWPENDPRAAIKFKDWLLQGDGIYWISGKPGSGKSTLMKYLVQCSQTRGWLNVWAGRARLAMPAYYFWIAGSDMQQSQQGLLQQLLFELLQTFPDLIRLVCPDRWGRQHGSRWTVSQLLETIQRLEQITPEKSHSTKICFFIDGLDEYSGDHNDLIKTVQVMARLRGVKLCVSSRPWLCFEDAFGSDPERKLYLQDLTRDDIATFARSKLTEGQGSGSTVSGHPESADDALIEEISQRAEGVFLWVHLVVRSLLDGIANGDDRALLQERLRELPTDLNEFFKRLILSVDKVYRRRMSSTFQVVLRTPQPLRLLQYKFLGEDNQETGTNHEARPASAPESRSELENRIRDEETKIYRQLNGRYKGLLEAKGYPELRSVDFLHRTVRDFLMETEMQQFFSLYHGLKFDPALHACEALVAQVRMFPGSLDDLELDMFMHWARIQEVQMGSVDIGVMISMDRHYHSSEPRRRVTEKTVFGKAIQYGIVSYVEYVTARDPSYLLQDSAAAFLLSFAPRKRISCPDLVPVTAENMLQLLLRRVSSPNQIPEGSNLSIFQLYLNMCTHKYSPEGRMTDPLILSHLLPTLLAYGADITQAFRGPNCWFLDVIKYLENGGMGPPGSRSRDHEQGFINAFAVFFKHGIDPNSFWPHLGGTQNLWKRVLAAILRSAAQFRHPNAPDEFEKFYIGLMAVFLMHGADPRFRVHAYVDPGKAHVPELARGHEHRPASIDSRHLNLFLSRRGQEELEPVHRMALQRSMAMQRMTTSSQGQMGRRRTPWNNAYSYQARRFNQ